MAFPLMAIGAGIGQFVDSLNQQRQQKQQQQLAMLRMQFEQARFNQELEQKKQMMGLSQIAGALGNPFGGGGLGASGMSPGGDAGGFGMGAPAPGAPSSFTPPANVTTGQGGGGNMQFGGGLSLGQMAQLDPYDRLIAQDESNFRNVPNYRYDPTHTAQGYFQQTNTNWRKYGNPAYPNAMAAPFEEQLAAERRQRQAEGLGPWANFNPKLSRDLTTLGPQAPAALAGFPQFPSTPSPAPPDITDLGGLRPPAGPTRQISVPSVFFADPNEGPRLDAQVQNMPEAPSLNRGFLVPPGTPFSTSGPNAERPYSPTLTQQTPQERANVDASMSAIKAGQQAGKDPFAIAGPTPGSARETLVAQADTGVQSDAGPQLPPLPPPPNPQQIYQQTVADAARYGINPNTPMGQALINKGTMERFKGQMLMWQAQKSQWEAQRQAAGDVGKGMELLHTDQGPMLLDKRTGKVRPAPLPGGAHELRSGQQGVLFQQPDGSIVRVTPDNKVEQVQGLKPGATKAGTASQAPPDPQTVEFTAKAIANYNMAPMSGWALRSKFGQEVMSKVVEQNPNYDATKYYAKQRGQVAFTTGRQSDTVRSFSVAIDHLATMQEAGEALANGDVQAINRVQNRIKQEFGYEGPVDFNFVKSIVGDEVAKAVIGGVGSQGDRQQLQAGFDVANSPEQLAGVSRMAKKLIAGQLGGLRRQAGTAGFSEKDFDAALSPRAKQELLTLGQGEPAPAGGSAPAPQQGAAPQGGGAPPPPAAVEELKGNPSAQRRQQFDEIFGQGAAARALGK